MSKFCKTDAIVIVGLAALSAVSLASHLPSQEKHDLEDGGYRDSKSWNKNWYVYRSIGGETTLKGEEKKRKWWCAWLCSIRIDKDAESILIQNTYFSEISPNVFSNFEAQPKECRNASSCTQKEWAIGGTIEVPFPGGGDIDNLLPIDGVVTRHEIRVDGDQFVELTASGKHPTPDGPIIE
jgi:hypothetical protein